MKVLDKNLFDFQEKDFFLSIRSKVDYAWVVLHSLRLLLLNYEIPSDKSSSFFRLKIDKMSRLFFYKERKFYSIAFPFNITLDEENNIIQITTLSGEEIDNKIISSSISVLMNDKFRLQPSPVDFWVETDSGDLKGLSLLEEIFITESGYIRYDHDEENENGKLHPLHHVDINYASYSTYKFGLDGPIIDTKFESIIDILSDCSYLRD